MERRINYIDMAKGYGILAVLIGHLVQSSILGTFVYSFHLPLFFFISGFLFRPEESFGNFLKHKARSILLPYFVLGLPVVFFAAYFPLLFSGRWFSVRTFFFAFRDNFLAFLIQNRYATLWYLAVLFFCNLVMFFIVAIKNRPAQLVTVLLLFCAAMAYYAFGGGPLPWDVDAVCPAVLFFWLGYRFRQQDRFTVGDLSKQRTVKLLLLALFFNILFNVFSLILTGEGLEMYWCNYGFVPFVVLSAVCGIFFVFFLSQVTEWKAISYIGKNSMLYFLWHQAIIYPVLDAVYTKLGVNDYYASPVHFVLIVTTKVLFTCGILFLLNELLKKTPLRVLLAK